MKTIFKLAMLAAAITLAGCATPAAKPGDVNIFMGLSAPAAKTEAEDAQLLAKAQAAIDKDGFPGLAPYHAPLRAALDRAPADYPLMAKLPNGDIVVRSSNADDGMMLTILAAGMLTDSKGGTVRQTANVYPMIAMLLGSEAVERGAYREAHAFLDRGLAMQANNEHLLAEKCAAYLGQQNWTAALDLADKAMAIDELFTTIDKGPFLRKRGFALTELGRLREARESYVEALKLDENDRVSQGEIVYIDRLLQGAAPTGSELVAPASRPDDN